MKSLLIIITTISINMQAQNKWPAEITFLNLSPSDSIKTKGNLSSGKVLPTLDWATSSSNACFTHIQSVKFMGNHVFYGLTIKPKTKIFVTVNPAAAGEELSLYGYMIGEKEMHLVPDLEQCITCESDYKRDRPSKWKVNTDERTIEFNNPSINTYNIIIGVSAPKAITNRDFIIQAKAISF